MLAILSSMNDGTTASTKTLALVGAGPGLGLSIAKRFGSAGFQVALLARNAGKLDQLVGELTALGVTARPYVANVGDRQGLGAALGRVEATSALSTSWSTAPFPAASRWRSPRSRPRAS